MRNQCGGLSSGAEPVRNQCGKPERQSSHVSLLFVFHVFGSLVRNQCVTSAGISQQCGTSAEPVRNSPGLGPGWPEQGFQIVSLCIFAISAQPVRNQCGVCRLVRNQCVTSALSPTHQFFSCDICEAFENMSNSSAQLSN